MSRYGGVKRWWQQGVLVSRGGRGQGCGGHVGGGWGVGSSRVKGVIGVLEIIVVGSRLVEIKG